MSAKPPIHGRRLRKRALWLLLLVAILIPLVWGAGRLLRQKRISEGPHTLPQPILESVGAATARANQSGHSLLRVRLSQGEAAPDNFTAVPLATGAPLSDAEIQAILNRLTPLNQEMSDAADFRLPEASLPPPRPGETILSTFPPPPAEFTPPEVAAGPLAVLRYAPEGEIPVAPFLSVTFNQPMTPLATLSTLAAADVPVRLTPALPGTWRWLGTQTLTFEYEGHAGDRFPMATEYVVEVPAGTRSAVGTLLEESVTWRFQTPTLRAQTVYPQNGPHGRDPLFFASFDQAVNPAALLEHIHLSAGNQNYPLRLATADEIAADEQVSRLAANGHAERQIVFRPQETLPADTQFSLAIGPGAPSAEGPRLTAEAQTFTFYTYAPLRLSEHRCGWYGNDCPPLTPFLLTFNNPLDPDSYDERMVRITPELPGAMVSLNGSQLTIQGLTQGRTTYYVTVDGDLQDIFGQVLGDAQQRSFSVGRASPLLSGPDRPFVTLDPARPSLTLYSVNYDSLRLHVYAVTAADWPAYQNYRRDYRRENPPPPPGRLLAERRIAVEGATDRLTETAVDLSEFLNDGLGQLFVIIEPPTGLLSGNRGHAHRVQAWVQGTRIGLDAFVDHSQMVVWTTALADGAPLPGVTIRPSTSDIQGATGDDGLYRFDLPAAAIPLLVAQQGDDIAFLPASSYYWQESDWQRQSWPDQLRWYVFDDRAMYRPGEEVHVKGWLRRIGYGPTGDVALVGNQVTAVRYRVSDPQGNQLRDATVDVNALGGFDFAFELPANMNLGYAQISLQAITSGPRLDETSYWHGFQVQEFRRPEFEVSARSETAGPYFAGESATVAVAANYYAGGPLPNADVTWHVTSSPGSYAPPNWPGFTFGQWTPWWYLPHASYGYYDYDLPFDPWAEERAVETFSGVTDAAGNHYLQLAFDAEGEPRPFTLRAEATVMDVNRQAWASATTLLVHPAELYVGLRSERLFVPRGTPLAIEAIVTDLDGNAISGQAIEVRAVRLAWRQQRGRWQEEEVDPQECQVTSTAAPVLCTFTTEQGGSYQITATVTDNQGRANQSQFNRWVSGGQRPPARNVEQESVTLIPNQESYQPGDVAEILVQAPFSPAEGLLIISRDGILRSEPFRLEGDSHTLHIPIEDAHIPNLHIQVELVGAAARSDDQGAPLSAAPPRPAYAGGHLELSIPPHSRALTVEATPRANALAPGESTTLDLLVSDANGRPVAGAELAVVVVDEAVLALTNYQLTDPLNVFYWIRSPGFASHYGRANIILANPELMAEEIEGAVGMRLEMATETEMDMLTTASPPMAAPEMAGNESASMEEAASPIQLRRDFNALATFAPAVRSDANGRAQVTIQLPDNLTRYRVMVVAVAGDRQFGTAEANLTARLPLMVRPSAPRFLNFGDQFELPVVLQNQTDTTLTVDVALAVTNLELTGPAGRRVTVPAHDRVEVRFPATTVMPGTARFQVAAVSGAYADAAVGEWPVYTPATTEAFATYGVLDSGAVAQPMVIPPDVYPQFGALEITTSSTAVQALTDAVLYLSTYPYDGSEHLASRILAIAALRDVLTAFAAADLPAPAELEAAVQRDIDQLQNLQNNNGGFPIWARGRDSIPFYTIYAAHALQVAQEKGFAVSPETQQRSLDYLRAIERHYHPWYGPQTRHSLSAYALATRHRMGDSDAAKARNLLQEAGLENMSLEALAWLWPVLASDAAGAADVAAIERHIANRAVETAAAANFFSGYGDDDYLMLHSNRRSDAIILETLISQRPESDLIPKVVNGLLAHRVRGRWSNTQENTFVLLALDRYFNTFEATTPDFVARIWLGETYAGEHTFSGRTTERRQTEIPMSYLAEWDETNPNLIVAKEGAGRLYYRLGLRYAPADLALEPLDMGFVVQRSYEAVDAPDDVIRDADGVWHIRAGARVRVNLTLVATSRRYHVALVDSLPAGLEIINPSLAVSESAPQDPNETPIRWGWWWWPWYEHQNLRDARAEAFTTLLWEGAYTYSYVARATTPGTFVAPPARAEEMYAPEVFGRSGSDWVVIK